MAERRQFKRIVRPLNIKFCFSDENPPQWNFSSVIGNISAGGVMFIAPSDLTDKVLKVEIQSPRWPHRTLKLELIVLDSQPSEHPSFFDVRAKFNNISQEDKKDLLLLENEQY